MEIVLLRRYSPKLQFDSPADSAICVRHHGSVHSSNLSQVPRRFLGRSKPAAAFQWRSSNQRLLCSLRISTWWLALDHGQEAADSNLRRQSAEGVAVNARWLCRQCPKRRGVLAVIVRPPDETPQLQAVNGRCVRCGYRLACIVIRVTRKRLSEVGSACWDVGKIKSPAS